MAGAESDDEEVYEVEAVCDRRTKNGGVEYLLQWKGYKEKNWTPVADCDCLDMIAEYDASHPPATPRATRNGGTPKNAPKGRSSGRSANGNKASSSRYREEGTPESWRNSDFEEEQPEPIRSSTMVGAKPLASTKLIPKMTTTGRAVPTKRAREMSEEASEKSDSDSGSVSGALKKKVSAKKAKKINKAKRAKKGSDEDNESDNSETDEAFMARVLPSTSRQMVPKLLPRKKKNEKKSSESKAEKSDDDDEDAHSVQWEVEAVVGRRNNGTEYQLKWKGSDDNTWTPIADCSTCMELIEEFDKKNPRPPATGKASKTKDSDGEESETSPIAATPKRGRTAATKRSSPIKRAFINLHEDTPEPTTSRRGRRAESTGSNERSLEREAAKTPDDSDDDGIINISDDDDLATRRAKARSAKTKKKNTPVVEVTDDSDEDAVINSPSKKKKKVTKNGVIEISDSDSDTERRRSKKTRARIDSDDDEEEEKEDSVPPKRACKSARVSKSARSAARNVSDDDDDEEESVARKSTRKTQPIRSNLRITGGDAEDSVASRASRSAKKTGRSHALDLSDNDEADDGSVTRRSSRSAKKNNADGSDDEDMEEEVSTPRTSRSAKKSQPASSSAAKTNGKANGKTEEKKKETTMGRPSLDDVLSSLVAENARVLKYQKNKNGNPAWSANQEAAPVRLFRTEQLPGIPVWTEGAYVDAGNDLKASTRQIEKFRGRTVEAVVGYAPEPTHPFVLVKLATEDDAGGLPVTEAIQAVHTQLASKLLPNAYTHYINRVAQLSQGAADIKRANDRLSGVGTSNKKK